MLDSSIGIIKLREVSRDENPIPSHLPVCSNATGAGPARPAGHPPVLQSARELHGGDRFVSQWRPKKRSGSGLLLYLGPNCQSAGGRQKKRRRRPSRPRQEPEIGEVHLGHISGQRGSPNLHRFRPRHRPQQGRGDR